jgi:hypothetical protein
MKSFCQQPETSLEKNIISADIGFIGIWINYERHLNGLFTLKSSLGLEGSFGQGFISEGKTWVAFIPTARLEPRYYYNFNRRVNLEKKTLFNGANYFAFTAAYYSGIIISNVSDITSEKGISLIPKWGIQRTIGQKISFQFAFGPGIYITKVNTGTTFGLDLRFGYNFK